jgi:hypothetical protein
MSIDNMWAIMATLGHWLQDTGTLMRWQSVDDGERVHKLMALIGCGFLTMLDCVDRFGSLGRDSEFKDLGLVMSLYLRFSDGLEDYSIDEESMAWRKYVIGYAKKARIDLVTGGCHEVRKILEDEENQDIAPLKDGSSRGGRWKWPKNVSVLPNTTLTVVFPMLIVCHSTKSTSPTMRPSKAGVAHRKSAVTCSTSPK